MRIGLVTHKFVRGDGQGRVNLEIAAEAVRRGWEVTLVASDVCPQLLESPRVSWKRIEVSSWPTELLRNQVFAWRSWRWLTRLRRQMDVICVNGFITWGRGHLNAAHYVHNAWLRSPYRRREQVRTVRALYQLSYSALNSALERWAYRRSDLIVAVSQQVKRQLMEIGLNGHCIRVIPNGVDTREFHPGAGDRTKFGIPQDGCTGIFAGQLKTPHKNLLTVLRALPACPGVNLIVAGVLGGDRYPSLARELGVADRVYFLGFQPEMAELMRAADFVVFPSVHDSSGLVLLEGMATGLPVITARTVGGAEMVAQDCLLILDDPEDVSAMAAAINSLSASEPLRAQIGSRAREEAQHLDFRTMAASYCDLFDSYARTRGTQ